MNVVSETKDVTGKLLLKKSLSWCVCVCVCVCVQNITFHSLNRFWWVMAHSKAYRKGKKYLFDFSKYHFWLLRNVRFSVFATLVFGRFSHFIPYCKTTRAKFEKIKKPVGLDIDPRYKPAQVPLKSDFSFFQSILHKKGTLGTKTTKFLKLTLFRFFNHPNDRSRVLNAADFDSRPLFTLCRRFLHFLPL